VAGSGWFGARPSGTEDIYKIYAESFRDQTHLDAIASEAQEIVNGALKSWMPHSNRLMQGIPRGRLADDR